METIAKAKLDFELLDKDIEIDRLKNEIAFLEDYIQTHLKEARSKADKYQRDYHEAAETILFWIKRYNLLRDSIAGQ